jgi:class 3 adenylate cyclase/tetratricopeptide (TPR) repeat protein
MKERTGSNSCLHCGARNGADNRFCEACGASLEAVCSACGEPGRASARFCAQCGTPMPAVPGTGGGRQARLTEGERKQVTVLFADLCGSTRIIQALDPEAAMHQLDPALQAMVEAVGRFGGVVNSVQGDGIMALFGVPAACEDHAVRACLAASAMLAAAAAGETGMQIRVGMDSGEVVVRPSGSDASDYAVTGVVAHIAHRVEQLAAPGVACLTSRTARLARGYVDLASQGKVAIKGLDEPLEIFQLLTVTARPSWEVRSSVHALNRFVGRDAEMAQIAAALGRAALGSGQVVTLVADAGFGKSRVVHEFLRALPSGAWQVLRAAAVAYTAQAPYHFASQLLRSWLGVQASDDRADVARRLEDNLALIDPHRALDLAPLHSLLDLPVVDEHWPRLSPAARRQRLAAALRGVIVREAAQRPLILMVEDYHWVDAPSAELLDAVVEGIGAAHLLLLATTRPERCPPWNQRSYCMQLRLPPLEPAHARALLQELLGPSADIGALREQILGQADGVPLFIEEIARALSETGPAALPRLLAGRGWRDDGVVVPASVQGIIAARIDRLPAGRRRLLQVASVIGKDVPLNLLEAVAGLPREELEREIAELQASEFLYELILPAGIEYTFRHVLIQTVAYEEILLKHRRELHARVVQGIEQLGANRLDELTEGLADHALRGEVWAAAVEYAMKAGDRAVGRGAWRDAVRYYDRAIEALEHLPVTPDTMEAGIAARLRLRVALPGLADLPRIARCLEEARRLAEQVGDPGRLVEIDTSQCLTLTKMGRLQQAIEAGQRGCSGSQRLGEPAAMLSASFALAQAYWYRGRFQDGERLLIERLPDARGALRLRQAGTTGTVSLLAHVCLAKTFAITGRAGQALEFADAAGEIARDTHKLFDLAYSHVGRGFCLLMCDRPDEAVAELEAGLQLARSGDIALLVPSSQRYLGRAYAMLGRSEQALRVLHESIERATSSGLLGMRLWSMGALAHAQLLAAPLQARDTLQETLAAAGEYGFRPLEVQVMRLLGTAHARCGGPAAQVEAWYEKAIRLADDLGMVPDARGAASELASAREAGSSRGQERIENRVNLD